MSSGSFLSSVQHFKALQVKAFIIQDPGMIHLFMQLDIDIIFVFDQP